MGRVLARLLTVSVFGRKRRRLRVSRRLAAPFWRRFPRGTTIRRRWQLSQIDGVGLTVRRRLVRETLKLSIKIMLIGLRSDRGTRSRIMPFPWVGS